MGSVADDYVCPHCDGRGYGGYAPDGVNYPICTQGKANCLDKLIKHGLCTRAMVKADSLKMIFVIRHNWYIPTKAKDIVNLLSPHISSFL